MSYQPLAGIKVLELAHLLPGPMMTRKMADLGAEVVKVEQPKHGDALRWAPPLVGDSGLLFEILNRGKKSIELDLKDPDGLKTFLALADSADVVVEGSRPRAFEKLGLDWRAVRERKPSLVVCSLSGFGQHGPLAQLPSHGYVMDSLSGCMTLTREGDRQEGSKVLAFCLEIGVANAAFATLAAVQHARATGRGAHIDASMWDAGAEAHRVVIGSVLADAADPRSLSSPLAGVYATADGGVLMFAALERKFFANFCRNVGRPDLLKLWSGTSDEDHRGEMGRGADSLRAELEEIFAQASAKTWTERFVEWDVAGGEVVEPVDLPKQDHFLARGLSQIVDGHPAPVLGDPIRFIEPDFRPGFDGPPAPKLGADTAEVLQAWLGS